MSDAGDAPQEILAEPWRRLAASATDAALLLGGHLGVMGAILLIAPDPSAHDIALAWASPIIIWLGVWLCWTLWGATPGKLFWRLRIVDRQGRRLTPARAALRCLTYGLAALPARLGFLPILWDPRRQGWHDRLAGTLVVRTPLPDGWQPPPRPPSRPLHLPRADFACALRGWWWPALAYLTLSLVMTWPLVRNFTTARPGAPGDGSVFMWDYWFVKYSLSHGLSPWHTDLLFYPVGVSVAYNTTQWFNSLLSWPLQDWLGLTAAYNVLFLFSVASSAFALYLLVTSLCHSRLCGFAAGLAYGFSPYFLVGRIEHQNLLAAQFLPVFALFAYALLTTGKARYAALGAVTVALLGLCDWYLLLFGMLIAVSLGFGVWWVRRPMGLPPRALGLLGISLLAGNLLLTPLILPMVADRATSGGVDVLPSYREAFKLDLLAYAVPNLWHSLMPPALRPVNEKIMSVGLALLALAVLGLRRHWRPLYPWLVVLVVATFVALGPSFRVAHHNDFPAALLLLGGGLPGNGFDMPWSTQSLLNFSHRILATPSTLWEGRAGVPLPLVWDWLLPLCTPLRPFKCPGRAGIVGVMALAVFGGVALSAILRRRRRAGRGGLVLLPLLVTGALLAEYAVSPLPMCSTAVHPFYHRLGTDAAPYAVLEAPFVNSYPEYQFYQTVHHKRLFAGHLARLPGRPGAFLESCQLLQLLTAQACVTDGVPGTLALAELPPAELHSPAMQARLRHDLHTLQRLDTRYLILHPPLLRPEDLAAARSLLEDDLGLLPMLDDGELVVYRLQPAGGDP